MVWTGLWIQHRLQGTASKPLIQGKLVVSTKASNLVYCKLLHCIALHHTVFSGHSTNCFNEVEATLAGCVAPALCNSRWGYDRVKKEILFSPFFIFLPQTHSHSHQHTHDSLPVDYIFYFYFSSKPTLILAPWLSNWVLFFFIFSTEQALSSVMTGREMGRDPK